MSYLRRWEDKIKLQTHGQALELFLSAPIISKITFSSFKHCLPPLALPFSCLSQPAGHRDYSIKRQHGHPTSSRLLFLNSRMAVVVCMSWPFLYASTSSGSSLKCAMMRSSTCRCQKAQTWMRVFDTQCAKLLLLTHIPRAQRCTTLSVQSCSSNQRQGSTEPTKC